jgi:hypothetical protein
MKTGALLQAQQLQLMTGVNPVVFWGASFLWDFFLMTLLVGLTVASLVVFQKFQAFTVHRGAGEAGFAWIEIICFRLFPSDVLIYLASPCFLLAGAIFLILVVFGYSAISFSYLASLLAQTVAGGFSFLVIIHVLTGIFSTSTASILN